MEIIAHRGASGTTPENTLVAIQKALDVGADSIEIDVRMSADKEIFLMHDSKVNRTTNGSGAIRKLTSAYIKTLDAGSWYAPQFADQKVPTLLECLELINGRAKLLLEVKSSQKSRYPEICLRINEIIKKMDAYNWVIFQAFDSDVLTQMHQIEPKIILNKLIVYNLGLSPITKIYFDEKLRSGNLLKVEYLAGINCHFRYATKTLVTRIHKADKKIYCWTANSTRTMKRLMRIGVDGIITNYPEKLKIIMGKKN